MTTELDITQPTGCLITTEPVSTKRFNSINEIINDYYFKKFVSEIIDELRKDRRERPAPKQGYHYIRNWYDRLSEGGNLNSTFFIHNIENIWLKKSSLSSEIRKLIKSVCNGGLQKTLTEYRKESEKKAL